MVEFLPLFFQTSIHVPTTSVKERLNWCYICRVYIMIIFFINLFHQYYSLWILSFKVIMYWRKLDVNFLHHHPPSFYIFYMQPRKKSKHNRPEKIHFYHYHFIHIGLQSRLLHLLYSDSQELTRLALWKDEKSFVFITIIYCR